MNDLQLIEFQILKEAIKICDKLNLRYYLVCGSALGAAKYKGFIPWDDDVDIALPRQDYNLFCEKAQMYLPNNLFLQNSMTDKYYPLIFSKIRNVETTYIEKSYSKININHGVYIDVFPLDGYPEDIKRQEEIEKEKKRYNLFRLCCLNVKHNWKTFLLVTLLKLFGIHKNPQKFINRIENVITQYKIEGSNLWCNHGNWQGKLEYAKKEQYGEGLLMEFEGLKVRVPEKIDDYLTQKYGDWRADICKEDKIGHHYYSVCDTKNTYKAYVKIISERKIKYINKL